MRVVDLTADLKFNEVDALLAAGDGDVEQNVEKSVADILADVRRRGDVAVCEYTQRFDEFSLTPELMRVTEDQLKGYADGADDELVAILHKAADNIRDFHEQQMEES